MNPERLQALAYDLFDLLERYEIDVDQFGLNIKVPSDYFETIKANFPKAAAAGLDFVVSENGTDWTITIGRPLDWQRKTDETE